jgi:LmbE family N-acetylglucosaminyl deacetylase
LERATQCLGLAREDLLQFNLPDGSLADHREALQHAVFESITDWNPTVVIVTSVFDPHADHAALGGAVHALLADSPIALFEYMIWGWSAPSAWLRLVYRTRHSSESGAMNPLEAVSVRSVPSNKSKRVALSCYTSQLGPSAAKVGLSSGTGTLSGKFLQHLLRGQEVFFPANRAASELVARRPLATGVASSGNRDNAVPAAMDVVTVGDGVKSFG